MFTGTCVWVFPNPGLSQPQTICQHFHILPHFFCLHSYCQQLLLCSALLPASSLSSEPRLHTTQGTTGSLTRNNDSANIDCCLSSSLRLDCTGFIRTQAYTRAMPYAVIKKGEIFRHRHRHTHLPSRLCGFSSSPNIKNRLLKMRPWSLHDRLKHIFWHWQTSQRSRQNRIRISNIDDKSFSFCGFAYGTFWQSVTISAVNEQCCKCHCLICLPLPKLQRW